MGIHALFICGFVCASLFIQARVIVLRAGDESCICLIMMVFASSSPRQFYTGSHANYRVEPM